MSRCCSKLKFLWWARLLCIWVLAGGGSLRASPALDNSSPVNFFNTAANLFLKTSGYNFTVTNIPIYPTNYYTPALHRLLQFAANLYDASTNRAFADGSSPNGPYYPTVFRPTFSGDGTNVLINGYVEDISAPGSKNAYDFQPLSLPEDLALVNASTLNIYGIPYVIGARKGFPNLDQFTMESVSYLTRKVELVRLSAGGPLQTNIQYILSISNLLGCSVWNSYTNAYSRSVDFIGVDNHSMVLSITNDATGVTTVLGQTILTPLGIGPLTIPSNTWAGFVPNAVRSSQNTVSFQVPLVTTVALVSNAVYHSSPPSLSMDLNFDAGQGYIQPHFLLNVTNRLRFVMTDHLTGRVIDYVTFNGMNLSRDLLAEVGATTGDGGIWDINRINGPTGPIRGVENQISVSAGVANFPGYANFTPADWIADQLQPTVMTVAVTATKNFIFGTTAGSFQIPFTPTREVVVSRTWQANDPLVHYLLSDLTPLPIVFGAATNYPASLLTPIALTNLAAINPRYAPWANTANPFANDTQDAVNLALKDPLITGSDAWQFPTNNQLTFASLGSVHRGTPWQTFYLKSTPVNATTWQNWTGDLVPQDSLLSMPVNDWNLAAALIPLLTPQDPHLLYGYNQSNPSNWAPAFQGMTVLTNTSSGLTSLVVDDTVNSNAIVQIVSGINAVRSQSPGGLFTNLAQLLAVPQLSVASPFINTAGSTSFLTDAAYESIPSQLLPLLRPDWIGSAVGNATPAQFQFTGFDGYPYNIQASTNLTSWLTVATLSPTNGVINFSDTNQAAFTKRFYRAALAP